MQKTALSIVKKLRKAGHETYFAGGWVRDFLLKRKHTDIDIVTSAKPNEIEKLLPKTVPIGKEFGVIQVHENGHMFEVATFRSDSGYSDGRRPDAVFFKKPEDDALRRDFTINGMFYDPIKKKVIDYVGGQEDLKLGLINFIGNANERVSEDHLRMLRAVRFRWSLNFQYHPDTYTALCKHASHIKRISSERIRDELVKILSSKNKGKALLELSEIGLLKHIIPELEKCKGVAQPTRWHKEGDVFKHTIRAISTLSPKAKKTLVFATLFHDIGKPDTFKRAERIRFDHHVEKSAEIAEKILHRLHFPNHEINNILWLIEHHMMLVPLKTMPTARKRHWFTQPNFPLLIKLAYADERGSIPVELSLIQGIEKEYKEFKKHIPKMKKPLLSGDEIMKMLKIKPGKKVGIVLEKIRHLQLEHKLKTKEEAKKWLSKLIK